MAPPVLGFPPVYEIVTGWKGLLAFWGGLVAHVLILVVLAALSGLTKQTAGVAAAAFGIEAAIYFAIDIAYVFGVELRMNNYFYDANNFPRPIIQRLVLLAMFFVYAAAANTFVVVLPALDAVEMDYWRVAFHSFAIGMFAYANLGLVQAWSYQGFPLELVGTLPLGGGLLSCFSSVLTVLICDSFNN